MKFLGQFILVVFICGVQCGDYDDDKESDEDLSPVKIDGKVYGHNIRVEEKLYYVSLQPAPWQEAFYFCRSKGLGLVEISNPEELTNLEKSVSEHRLDGWSYWTRDGDDISCRIIHFPRPAGPSTKSSVACSAKNRYICEPLV